MANWKIVMLFLVAWHQILADDPLSIIGDELEGANVCKRIDRYNVTVVVTETVPYQERKTVWCAQIPPRCSKMEVKMRQVNKTEVLEKERPIRECCEGYIENPQRNRCIPHCPKPCINGLCIAPGQCKCEKGYGGISCSISCPPLYYGEKCKKKCSCSKEAYCDPFDGKCICNKGFTGDLCDATCPPYTYGEGCGEKCRCQNGAKCNHVSGECYCPPSYYGPLCEFKCTNDKSDECKSVCRCQNEGFCDEDTALCKCPPGWTGDVCANRCQPGRYGAGCFQACECFNGATCDHVSGSCVCEPGFVGDKCLDQCSFDKFGVNCNDTCSCENGARCDKATGHCHCAPGFIGSDCSMRACPENKYGPECAETCECDADHTESCHPHDGSCACKAGYSSKTCNRSCPFLRFGDNCAHQCDCKNNAVCSSIDGSCECQPGWTGDKCDESCSKGTYGQGCSQRCACKHDAECSSETGQCFCKPGWSGIFCERPCEIGKYGEGCAMTCNCQNNGGCHPVSGECYCLPGWTGTLCEKKCDKWFFGQNCSQNCSCETSKTLTCDPINGACICKTDYSGSEVIKYAGVRCESSCPLGFYGPECRHQCNCKNNSSCDPITGDCTCERGWQGRTCDQPCPKGTFGRDCQEICNQNMPAKTTCDHVTGDFKCRPGYIGVTCEHPCKEGSYGQNCQEECHCENGGECSHIDGVCHCLPGWMGDKCENSCANATWGNSCQHKCRCLNQARCRKSDGLCVCEPGFMGIRCEEVCPEGYFGANCLEICNCYKKPNSVCHFAHGCVCRSGYTGPNCEDPSAGGYAAPEGTNTGAIWGICLLFAFAIIIMTLLFYYRRRVANLKAEITHVVKYFSEEPNNFDNPVYSYQQGSVATDASTLLHRNGAVNNLRQTKPLNIERLNNFDQESNSSGRAGAYTLQYDSQLMKEKNREADLTNPNVYHTIEDHLYDEIKIKGGCSDVEYDHLDYTRPVQKPLPHYTRTTSSAMSALSYGDRESNPSNSNFPSSFSESTYDAPTPHPKQLNICVPPLPMKNQPNKSLTPSPSSSAASTITQDDNMDAVISIEKPMNKSLLSPEKNATSDTLNDKSRDDTQTES